MNSLELDKNNIQNPVEEFFATTDKDGGYVIVISKDNIVQSNVFHHTHDATLKRLLNQIGDSFPLDNNEDCWSSKQGEGYVLMRMMKDLNVVYMPDCLSKFQYDTVSDIQDQIASYEAYNNSNVTICVSDGGYSYYFDQMGKLEEYLDSKRPHTK